MLVSYAAEVGKEEGFNPPDAGDFNLPPFIEGNEFATKPILLVFLSVLLISVFFIISSRKAAVVPSKLQFAGESITHLSAMISAGKLLATSSCALCHISSRSSLSSWLTTFSELCR